MEKARLLTEKGKAFVDDPKWLEEQAGAFAEHQFLQWEDVVDFETITHLVARTLDEIDPAWETVKYARHQTEPGRLFGGLRFSRIDYGPHEGADWQRHRKLERAFEHSGLLPHAVDLMDRLLDPLGKVAGAELEFDRVFILKYDEGDFIDPHGDTQSSRRILVAIPLAFDCASCVRFMVDGMLKVFYDVPGCLRVQGAGVWHDVPPVLRINERPPRRYLVVMRLPIKAQL